MYNLFIGIGNLAADVESRYTQSGKQVASFTVCCDSGYGDSKKTEFVRCVAWDKLAEIATNYLSKGSKCMVQGTMQTRQWDDKDGQKRYSTEIIVREMKLLSPRSEGQRQDSGGNYPEPPPMGDDVPFS